ncbi:hypothetical protein [Nocardia beijingensis]
MPELGERFDPRNVTHSMMMSMLGGLSESERQHVQQRTRASMDAQVLNEGRPPYGYVVVDGPPHPNPNRVRPYLLSALVRCVGCGRKMRRKWFVTPCTTDAVPRPSRLSWPFKTPMTPTFSGERFGNGSRSLMPDSLVTSPRSRQELIRKPSSRP